MRQLNIESRLWALDEFACVHDLQVVTYSKSLACPPGHNDVGAFHSQNARGPWFIGKLINDLINQVGPGER
jgi:hypothetical protein